VSGNLYVFDQSSPTNIGNTLVLGTSLDVSSSVVGNNVVYNSTPGSANAYTLIDLSGTNPATTNLYYFSSNYPTVTDNTNGLIWQYKLDSSGTGLDISGSYIKNEVTGLYDATIINPSYVAFSTSNSIFGSGCLNLNPTLNYGTSTNGYVSLPTNYNFNSHVSGYATICGWFKVNNNFTTLGATNPVMLYFMFPTSGNTNGMYDSASFIEYNTHNGDVTYNSAVIKNYPLTLRLHGSPLGHYTTDVTQWHHVVMVMNCKTTSDFNYLYVNGSVVVSGQSANAGAQYTGSIGHCGWDASGFIKGSIKDFRVYNRALSASEITALYNYRPSVSMGGRGF
jgi:hypothetical protein